MTGNTTLGFSLRARVLAAMRYLGSAWRGRALVLHPIDQVVSVAGEQGQWRSIGNDPKFDCLGHGFPLKAGWYLFSMDLQDAERARLEPMLYFDYGYGMHESWSAYLHFADSDATDQVGVILLPMDVQRLRFDPASVPCLFHAEHLRLRRINRLEASARMLLAVRRRERNKSSAKGEGDGLISEGWEKLRGPGGRNAFASWLHGRYILRRNETSGYHGWLSLYDTTALPEAAVWDGLISIVMPTFNTAEIWLRRCLESVLAQSWSQWELCVADDASTDPCVRKVLEEFSRRDRRIRVTWRKHNGHISAASNSALNIAQGKYVALLDHDDELHPHALSMIAEALQRHPQWQLVYSDEDKIDADGQRYDPYFKPDWNPDLLHGQNCISHLGVYSRELVAAVGGFREGLDGSQDWDLALRCSERLTPKQIGHVPAVLYHWRAIAGSTAQGVEQKSYAHDAARRALSEHFSRCGEAATVMDIDGLPGAFRVRHPLPARLPLVSIVVPSRDRLDLLQQCVNSILERTTYSNYEILIVDNQSSEPDCLAYLAAFQGHPRVRVSHHDKPFNYSVINNEAVADCRGSLICLLNNDIQVITPDWLEELASHALRPHVGAVGAMLYYPNDTIQHAGVMVGVHGVAAHPYCGMPRGYGGQMARARLTQAMSAVTAACMMIRREVYEAVGGLDASLQVAFNDVDLCLRLHRQGYTNIWTPFAELYHHESASRGHEDTLEKRTRFAREVEFMKRRWGSQLEFDPAYNPNLTLSGEPFSLAFPPRDWRQRQAANVTIEYLPVDRPRRVSTVAH